MVEQFPVKQSRRNARRKGPPGTANTVVRSEPHTWTSSSRWSPTTAWRTASRASPTPMIVRLTAKKSAKHGASTLLFPFPPHDLCPFWAAYRTRERKAFLIVALVSYACSLTGIGNWRLGIPPQARYVRCVALGARGEIARQLLSPYGGQVDEGLQGHVPSPRFLGHDEGVGLGRRALHRVPYWLQRRRRRLGLSRLQDALTVARRSFSHYRLAILPLLDEGAFELLPALLDADAEEGGDSITGSTYLITPGHCEEGGGASVCLSEQVKKMSSPFLWSRTIGPSFGSKAETTGRQRPCPWTRGGRKQNGPEWPQTAAVDAFTHVGNFKGGHCLEREQKESSARSDGSPPSPLIGAPVNVTLIFCPRSQHPPCQTPWPPPLDVDGRGGGGGGCPII